jgi:hypothetical protein
MKLEDNENCESCSHTLLYCSHEKMMELIAIMNSIDRCEIAIMV